MSIKSKLMTGAVAAAMVIASAVAAMASPAVITSYARLYANPGSGTIGHVYAGQHVNVVQCTQSQRWCYVDRAGPNGWVNAAYLNFYHTRMLERPYPYDRFFDDRYNDRYNDGFYDYPTYPSYPYMHNPGFCAFGGGGSICIH